MNAQLPLFALAALLTAAPVSAQDRTNPDGNTDSQNPRNPIPQGAGSPPFGQGQPADTRFGDTKKSADVQTGAKPTDARGEPNDLETANGGSDAPALESNPAPSRPDVGSPMEQTPSAPPKKKGKSAHRRKPQARQSVERVRGRKDPRKPGPVADPELPAVSEPGKDGTLIEDGPPPVEVPHD